MVGVCSLHEQFRVRDRQLQMRSAVCVCVCVCMCMYISVDSMGKEESCKAGVWNCGYFKFFCGREKGRHTYIQFVHS